MLTRSKSNNSLAILKKAYGTRNTFLFSFKQTLISKDLDIWFLRPSVSKPHAENSLSTLSL